MSTPDFSELAKYLDSLPALGGWPGSDCFVMLHGDLVFDAAYVASMLGLPSGSYGSVDATLPRRNASSPSARDSTETGVSMSARNSR